AALTRSVLALDEEAACRQGKQLSSTVGTTVLVKGGHARGPQAVDLLLPPDGPAVRFEAARLKHRMRGTGCMLSTAVATFLALGASLEESVRGAKQYVFERFVREGAQ
ncbi:hydroxymethylpyrimidine/phosphomethylpyrimidine kinase, partial [bacterium M00.F.Ca.ET.163.01.1.1]